MRSRKETEDKLLNAAGRVLARDGFLKLGVNAVAREAGVDKVLIYRYFDGLDGLIKAYARQGDFWPSLDELIGEPIEQFRNRKLADQMKTIMTNLAEGIRKRPLTLEILAWEMVERNELTAHLEEIRERKGLELTEAFSDNADPNEATVDVAALIAITVASINYLAARSRKIKIFNGIDIREDEGWGRLTGTMATIFDKCL